MSDPSLRWSPPPSEVTQPDQLSGEAWRAFDPIDGEKVLNVWRTPRGFLVLTNLRCFGIRRELDLFGPPEWRTGPEFYFYNLKPPQVLFGRFVELSEEVSESGAVGRFPVKAPEAVAEAIAGAAGPGRDLWRARRAQTQQQILARKQLRTQRAAEGMPPIPLERCRYCGNLVNANLRRCPSCGAPLA